MSSNPVAEATIRVIQPLRRILPAVLDIEERDCFGRTALLHVIETVHHSHFPEVAHMLLNAGADHTAVDNGGCGILHFILRVVSACNNAPLLEAHFEAFKSVVVRLLGAGCDPSLLDEDGSTPSDMALSPTGWLLWCESVRCAGRDMSAILKLDDRRQRISHKETALDAEHRRVKSSSPPWEQQLLPAYPSTSDAEARTCGYCSAPLHWTTSRSPFDTYGSYMVEFGGRAYHAYFANHKDASFCENAAVWNSCRHGPHKRGGPLTHWSDRESSRRKHLAYRLWKDGLWQTPSDAYEWATGLSPDW